ncbi:MAG: hypothetical protein R3F61_06600 [Myxococcota bacterium]
MNQRALDTLRREVVAAIYGQDQWLESIVVGLPAGVDAKAWAGVVEAMLCDLQLDGVDVTIAAEATSAPWLQGFELKPGWS